MLTNIELFEYSKARPEELLDSFYAKNKIILPMFSTEDNNLTINNKKLLHEILCDQCIACMCVFSFSAVSDSLWPRGL